MTVATGRGKPLTTKQRLLVEREYITPRQLSELTGIAMATLYNWASAGVGPTVYKFGTRNRYLASEIEEWMEAARNAS